MGARGPVGARPARTSLSGPCARLAPLKCTVKSTAQFLLEAPGGHLVRGVTAGNRTCVESRAGRGPEGPGAAAAGAEAHSDLLHKRGGGARRSPLLAGGSRSNPRIVVSPHSLPCRATPHVPRRRDWPGGARGCHCEPIRGPGPGPCPGRLRGLAAERARGSMVSAEAAAAGRSARFDVPGGPLKLAGRLFRGALRAGAERSGGPGAQRSGGLGWAALRAQAPSPAWWPGWRGPRGRDFCKWLLRRGRRGGRLPPPPGSCIAVVVMDVSRGVSVRWSAFGRWDERVAAPLACPPLRPFLPPPLPPSPSSPPASLSSPPSHWSALRGPERWPRLSLRAGAARALGARVPRLPLPLLRRGRDSARRHFWTRLLLSLLFLRAPPRAAAPGTDPRPSSGCCERLPGLWPRARRPSRRGSGRVGLDLGRGWGRAGGAPRR